MEKLYLSPQKKPAHIFKGMYQGIKTFLLGFWYGIFGVFTAPINGCRNEGIKDGILGVLKGAFGLIVHPIAGSITLVTKIAVGIKNSPRTIWNKLVRKKKRRKRIYEKQVKNNISQYNRGKKI